MSVRYLTEADVEATLTMRDALDLVDAAARAQAEGNATNRPRQRVRTNGTTLHVLPASIPGFLGHKCYTSAKRGGRFWFTLYAASGEMLAIVEADLLGAIRTGAASGIATRALARTGARTIGIVGTGYQARTQIEGICGVLPIERIAVFGRDESRRRRFASEMQAKLDRPVHAAATAREAVDGADIIVTMTDAAEPVVFGEWLAPGVHVNAAGSNRPANREIDEEVVRRADRIVVEDLAQAKVESGDLRYANEADAFNWQDAITLSDVVAGKVLGRTSESQITLFESLGIGLWDVAVGRFVYEAARERHLGTPLGIEG